MLEVFNEQSTDVDRQTDDSWVASFPGTPRLVATAEQSFSAISKRIDQSGDPNLNLDTLRPTEEKRRSDHLEFEIPRADWRPRVLAD